MLLPSLVLKSDQDNHFAQKRVNILCFQEDPRKVSSLRTQAFPAFNQHLTGPRRQPGPWQQPAKYLSNTLENNKQAGRWAGLSQPVCNSLRTPSQSLSLAGPSQIESGHLSRFPGREASRTQWRRWGGPVAGPRGTEHQPPHHRHCPACLLSQSPSTTTDGKSKERKKQGVITAAGPQSRTEQTRNANERCLALEGSGGWTLHCLDRVAVNRVGDAQRPSQG